MQALFHDCRENIDGYGNPDLSLNGISGGTIEGLDSEMLFNPFEEQLVLPSAFVQLCDGQGRQGEVVGKEHQPFACFGVVEIDFSDLIVDKSLYPLPNNIVIAVIGGEFLVKRLITDGGAWILVGDNPDFGRIESREGDQVEVWGVVTWFVHKL